ncbi:MAG: mercury(II) reductase [Candidatus Obscuribacterales bacterium]
MIDHFDLVILGSGSTAYSAAIGAAGREKSVLMTEMRSVGGTCLHRGCVPSKNLIEAAGLCHHARHFRFPGLKLSPVVVDFPELISQKDEVISALQQKKYLDVVAANPRIAIRPGRAEFIDPHTIAIEHNRVTADHILIATGSQPVVPLIRGLEEVPYLTSDLLTNQESMELKKLPESLVIIGGGYIALELGQMFARLGSQVCLLERSAQLLPHYEPEIGIALSEILRSEGLDIRVSVTIDSVAKGEQGIRVHTSSGPIDGTHLLIAAGRRPNTEHLHLEAAGVQAHPGGHILVNKYLQTTVPHIWAAGDVVKGPMATPVGAHDGSIVASNAFSSPKRVSSRAHIPRAIFTDPQVAVVGMTDAEATASGLDCECRTVSMEHVPRAVAVRDTRGLIKMVAERDSGRILGVSILAPNAAEFIHIAMLAIRADMTVNELIEHPFVYPTYSEAIKIAALAFKTDVTQLSCCAEGAIDG